MHFELKVPGVAQMSDEEIMKKFKLQTSLSCNNYVLFDEEGRVGRYGTADDILKHWYNLRGELYERRKEH